MPVIQLLAPNHTVRDVRVESFANYFCTMTRSLRFRLALDLYSEHITLQRLKLFQKVHISSEDCNLAVVRVEGHFGNRSSFDSSRRRGGEFLRV